MLLGQVRVEATERLLGSPGDVEAKARPRRRGHPQVEEPPGRVRPAEGVLAQLPQLLGRGRLQRRLRPL